MTRPAIVWAALATVGLLGAAPAAGAGWVVISNDTPAVLVVQECADTPAAAVIRPKSVRMLPGEVYREYHLGEGKKTIQVFDARTPDKAVYKGTVTWGSADLSLTLEPDGTKVKLSRVGGPATVSAKPGKP